MIVQIFWISEMCSLSDNIYDYYNVSQGKVTVPNMDDGEEFQLADVSFPHPTICNIYTTLHHSNTSPYTPTHTRLLK